LCEYIEAAISEINNSPAIGTNQMMVVLRGASEQIAFAIALAVDYANKSQFSKNVQCSIYGNKSDIWILVAEFFIDSSRGEVFVA